MASTLPHYTILEHFDKSNNIKTYASLDNSWHCLTPPCLSHHQICHHSLFSTFPSNLIPVTITSYTTNPNIKRYHGIKMNTFLYTLPPSSFLAYIKTLPDTEKEAIGHIISYAFKIKDIIETVTRGTFSLSFDGLVMGQLAS